MPSDDSYFSFTTQTADLTRGTVTFGYELKAGQREFSFHETLIFPPPSRHIRDDDPALLRIFQGLHMALGMSYWKTVCPPKILTGHIRLSPEEADFWNTLYTKGLGEFFYENSIDFRGLVKFPSYDVHNVMSHPVELADRSLVLLGAGKDSIVTGELLKAGGRQFSFVTLNPTPIHREVAKRMGIPLIEVTRIMDPALFALNKEGSVYNGHVPITSIFSLVAVLSAFLLDYRYVVASNEESASYGNVSYLGSEINHQWSKSLEFERLFRDYIGAFLFAGIEYFSLLRRLTEFNIAGIFARHQAYFDAFTSCNANFTVTGDPVKGRWCGKCPKCAFVFLVLAAWLPKKTVMDIFGMNLLDDHTLVPVYKQLLGIEGFKPFECVGTPEESRAAFLAIDKKQEFEGDAVIRAIGPVPEGLPEVGDPVKRAMRKSDRHHIPESFLDSIPSI